MTESSAESRRTALYLELAEVVEKFVALDNEDSDGHSMATAHVLLIGTEEYDPSEDKVGGAVTLLPAGGKQPSWKTCGLVNMAKAYLEVDHFCA